MISRSAFLAAASAAAMPLVADATLPPPPVGPPPTGLSGANERAARIASSSRYVSERFYETRLLAESIRDATLRESVRAILDLPVPLYQRRYPTLASRVALRDAFAREDWIAVGAPTDGIFPPVGAGGIAQPFWSTPGSAEDSHHAYPGGLCVHELFNARMSDRFASNYDGIYFSGRTEIERDLCVAAALYHDIMKTVVFQYRDGGTFTQELEIAGTGGHHVLSGAEAIVRGHDARFVTVLLSAHAAPSLGDESKVVTWCRAAAMLAGVDPIAFELVRKTADGYALAEPPPVECFISHLSDHDYVFTVLASQVVRPALAGVASQFGVPAGDAAALNWWRLRICANASMVELYHELLEGESKFLAAVKRAYD